MFMQRLPYSNDSSTIDSEAGLYMVVLNILQMLVFRFVDNLKIDHSKSFVVQFEIKSTKN